MSSDLQLLEMGIVDQLGSSLISMFLESSLRLAHVINADFFILVQSPTGARKVAGSDNLCREFASGSLAGDADDVRTLLRDLEVPILEERLMTINDNDDDNMRMRYEPNSVYESSTPKSNHHQPRLRNADHLPPMSDQINPFSSSGCSPVASSTINATSHFNDLRTRGPKICESNGRMDIVVGKKRHFDASTDGVTSKKSRPNVLFADDAKTPRRNEFGTTKIECFDDEDVELIPLEVPEYEDSDGCPVGGRQSNQFKNQNDDYVTFNGDQSSCIAELGFDTESGFDLQPVQEYMSGNPKVACILERLATGTLDLTRQSSDIRLFGSIMYDLGKMLSKLVTILDKSHPETKKHFSQAFHIICTGLPGLEAVSQEATAFKDTFRGLTLKAHLRCQLYSAFKNSLARLIKNHRETF